jgi:DNA-binding response OmpR family regulator
MNVLLIDDDVDLTAMLGEYLSREGFDVAAVHDGTCGLIEALSGNYSLVVLDVIMAGLGGMDILRRIRSASQVPVLMLSAKRENSDRIRGLELGADDYVPKPCPPRELAARIRAILRRCGRTAAPPPGAPLVIGALAMWPERRHAQWDGRPLDLTSTEFKLLEVLARNAGSTVSKGTLSDQALGRPLARYDRIVDVHLSSLRRKLGPSGNGRSCIQTIQRVGYQFIKPP